MTYGWAPQPGGDFGRLRAGHADRERAIDVLKAAFAEGRLDQDEYTDRVGMVHASRTYAELTALTADLPVGPLALMTSASQLVPADLRLPQPPPPAWDPADGDAPTRGLGLGLAILFCGIAMLCGILALLAMMGGR
jgi:DUF1707 SHOCT-like domain